MPIQNEDELLQLMREHLYGMHFEEFLVLLLRRFLVVLALMLFYLQKVLERKQS
ncbi:hypothetical protein D3C80_2066580 [compost metagenome]